MSKDKAMDVPYARAMPPGVHHPGDPPAHPGGGGFPDGQSALMLSAARLRRIAGSKWDQKRYLNMDLLKDQELEEQITVVSARSQ